MGNSVMLVDDAAFMRMMLKDILSITATGLSGKQRMG